MITRRHMLAGSAAALAAPPMLGTAFAQGAAARITILVDAFGEASNLKRGWGYSAFIEYGGRRILFDTGSRGADFANNANALGVDLKKLDFVVVSHRHNDHTGGLSHVLSENPDVPVYTPFEVAGFNSPLGPAFDKMTKRDIPSLPVELRYFWGGPAVDNRSEAPWEKAKFVQITQQTEVLPGFFLMSNRSSSPGTIEMNEVSLAFRTPKGAVLVVGCSHPGIENIVEATTKIDRQIYTVFGGFHLLGTPDEKVTATIVAFRDKWRIERMAAGHCTGQFAFAELVRIYGPKFDIAGLGSVISLPV